MVPYTHWILMATASKQKVKVSPVHLSAGNSACWEPNRSDHDTTGNEMRWNVRFCVSWLHNFAQTIDCFFKIGCHSYVQVQHEISTRDPF